MSRRLLIFDIILAAILVAGGFKLYRDWLAFEATHQVGSIQPQPEPSALRAVTAALAPEQAGDWTEVALRNPFSFDRTDIPAVRSTETPKPVQPKPILFGTISLGKDRLAMLASGQPGNRAYRPMKVGESIDGWALVEIHDKSVIVQVNGTRETVLMNDPSAQVPRDHTRTLVSAAPPPPVVIESNEGLQPPPTASRATMAPGMQQPAGPGQPSGPTRTRVIDTPFGKKVIEVPPQ